MYWETVVLLLLSARAKVSQNITHTSDPLCRSEFSTSCGLLPSGDQPVAIQQLLNSLRSGNDYQTLLGVTGSGKLSPWQM